MIFGKIFYKKKLKNENFWTFFGPWAGPRAGLLKLRPGPGRPLGSAALQGPARTPRAGLGRAGPQKWAAPGSPDFDVNNMNL